MRTTSLFLVALSLAAVQVAEGQRSREFPVLSPRPRSVERAEKSPLPPGIYTVGSGGDFSTLYEVSDFLRYDGITGPVTFLLTDTLYVATPYAQGSFAFQGPVMGAGPDSRITIRPADNVAVTIRGNGESVLLFQDVSYLTLDGIDLAGPTRLSVHALYNTEGRQWNDPLDLVGDCDFDVIRNLSTWTDDINRPSLCIGLGTSSSAGPDSCLIYGNAIRSGKFGIYIYAFGPYWSFRPMGNVVAYNQIGSANDSLISRGIQIEGASGTVIESNHVQHLRLSLPDNSGTARVQGINAYACMNTIIRNNVIHDISGTVTTTLVKGLLLSGDSDARGRVSYVYNNMIYDIRRNGGSGGSVAGAHTWYNDSLTFAHNSIFLEESGDVAPSNGSFAAAFEVSDNSLVVLNNIFVNTRDDSPYLSTAMDMNAVTNTVDFNNLVTGESGNAYMVRSQGRNYKTLAGWKTTGHDLHSVSVLPVYRPPHLHIDPTDGNSYFLDGSAAVIPAIARDIDDQLRDAVAPDIGADEFDLSPYTDVAVQRQWNLISTPRNAQDCRVTTLFPGATSSAFGFSDHYVAEDSADCGRGYWLKFGAAETTRIYGEPMLEETVDVQQGWNLIGSLSSPVPVATIASIPPGMLTSDCFGYAGGYTKAEQLIPGHGYWIKVQSAGSLIISCQAKSNPEQCVRINIHGELPPQAPEDNQISTQADDIPREYILGQNYPNPFNASTIVRYSLPVSGHVSLAIFDLLGRHVDTVVDGVEEPGYKAVTWEATDIPSGIYFCRLAVRSTAEPHASFVQLRKIILMK